jgi:hypothetical protein
MWKSPRDLIQIISDGNDPNKNEIIEILKGNRKEQNKNQLDYNDDVRSKLGINTNSMKYYIEFYLHSDIEKDQK